MTLGTKLFFLLHNMGPKNFLFSIIGYILYKIKIFSDPYYVTKKKFVPKDV